MDNEANDDVDTNESPIEILSETPCDIRRESRRDTELLQVERAVRLIAELDPAAQRRVVAYLASRYSEVK